MIDSTVLFQEAIRRDSRSFHSRFLAGSQVIEGNIRSVTIRKGSCGTSEFAPGAVFCSYIEATIDNCGIALEGRELELQIGVMTNSDLNSPSYEYIRIGIFRVGKPSANSSRTTFAAQGRITAYMNMAFTVPQTKTLAAVAAQITALTGVLVQFAADIDTSLPVGGSLENLSCRDALAVLAAVTGGYATETSAGDVIIKHYSTEVTASYTEDAMTERPAFADFDMGITGIKVIAKEAGYDEEGEETEEVSYTSGDPVNIEITNSYMTSQAFPSFAANLVGLQYRPGMVPLALGDPRLEPWDTIQVTDLDGHEYIVPCMDINMTYDGGVQVLIEAPALQDEMQSEGTVAKAMKIAVAAGNAAVNARKAAEQAERDAETAARAAEEAQNSAESAGRAASEASRKADAAANAAETAEREAAKAGNAAAQANSHANSALTQLSVVQDVIGTLDWITRHGTYTKTSDTAVDEDKTYFVYDSVSQSYTAVAEPKAEALSDYYELSIDQALDNFIASHLSVTNEGLWVQLAGASYKLLIANDGVYVYDDTGRRVAAYGESISFDSGRPQYIGSENAFIAYYDSDNDGIADSIRIGGTNIILGGSKKLSEVLQDVSDASFSVAKMQQRMDSGEFKGEDATVLRIDSSRGVLFKNNYFSTVLTVTIQKGPLTITNASAMHAEYGAGAYLQWYWRKFDDEDWKIMLVTDSHIANDGFTLTVTPNDVDEKIVFKCELEV